MPPELTVLALAGLLQGVQYVLVSVPANLQLGTAVTTAPRDDGPLVEKVDRGTARLGRALNNHFEALILFTMAVVVVTLADKASLVTALCAWVYLAARVLYIPAYYRGWAPGRSVIWATGWFATMAMFAAALL